MIGEPVEILVPKAARPVHSRHRETEQPPANGPGVVRIDVIDTGIGISPADQERLFEAFEQLGNCPPTQEGTGSAFHISRKLAELLAATIRCTSVPGQGSTFTVELKRA